MNPLSAARSPTHEVGLGLGRELRVVQSELDVFARAVDLLQARVLLALLIANLVAELRGRLLIPEHVHTRVQHGSVVDSARH